MIAQSKKDRLHDVMCRMILMIFLASISCMPVGLPFVATARAGDETEPVQKDKAESHVEVMKFVVNIGSEERKFLENTYVVFNTETKAAVLIDPGTSDERIEKYISSKGLAVKMILNTHGHHDHIGGNTHYAELYKVKIGAHRSAESANTAPDADQKSFEFLDHDQVLEFDGLRIGVLHTPGHSEDGVCFLVDKILFAGDTLFKESIGRTWGATDQERKDKARMLITQIKQKLLVLSDETTVHPGHGESTSIKHEKMKNPFLR